MRVSLQGRVGKISTRHVILNAIMCIIIHVNHNSLGCEQPVR